MPILLASDLAAYIKEPDAREASLNAALTAAENLVASYIGAEGLLAASRAESVVIRLSTRVVPTLYGPVTGVSSVMVNGEDVTATTGYHYWYLHLQDETGDGATVEMAYTTGWAADALPDPIRQAILMTAASIYARPDAGLARVVSPNLTEVYRSNYLSDAARMMLDPYRRATA